MPNYFLQDTKQIANFSTAPSGNVTQLTSSQETFLASNPNATYDEVQAEALDVYPTDAFENEQTGTSYTLQITDVDRVVSLNNSSSNSVVVPANSSVAFPVGTEIVIYQKGTGATTITPSPGVNIDGVGSLTSSGQHQIYRLLQISTDNWIY